MQLTRLEIVDYGPVRSVDIALRRTASDRPIPTVLLGRNGYGKSIALALITNALLAMQQVLFDNPDVRVGRVYKLRSPSYIRAGAKYSWSSVTFDRDLRCTEWQLIGPKHEVETSLTEAERTVAASRHAWSAVPRDSSSVFNGNYRDDPARLRSTWASGVELVFPADRHDAPAWQNEGDLLFRPTIGAEPQFERRTLSPVLRTTALKEISSWLLDVALDSKLQPNFEARFPSDDSDWSVVSKPIEQLVAQIFNLVVRSDESGIVLGVGRRRSRVVGPNFLSSDGSRVASNSMLSLSSGEAQLFSLFASILMEYDKAGHPCGSLSDVRGVVVIDEADLHLHVDLQASVLPRLIASFPSVQFILTTHFPLLALGLERELGRDGVHFIEMPSGREMSAEDFSEFGEMFGSIRDSAAFRREAISIRANPLPLLLTEGRTDAEIIRVAWEKVHRGVSMPFQIRDAGQSDKSGHRTGGAKLLEQQLFAVSELFDDRLVLAVFDHDCTGISQLNGAFRHHGAAVPGKDWARKHRTRPHWAILIPVPESRRSFHHAKFDDEADWFVEIEHMFSNAVLIERGLAKQLDRARAEQPFAICSQRKAEFARSVADLDEGEFVHFRGLFDRLAGVGFIDI